VVGVSTPRQRAGARPDPLRAAAEAAGLPVIETPALRQPDAFEAYRAWAPDLLVFAFVTDIVRRNVLEVPTHGAIQYHPSLLPRHRGRSAMNWSIMAGEATTGLTIFWVDEGIDTGPVLLQREVPIEPGDTVGSLYFERLYPLGIGALADAVRMVREGTAPRIPQDEALASYEPPAGPEHAAIDWSRPGIVVHNHIRGCDPQPGAQATLDGGAVGLFGSHFAPGHPSEPPGTVLAADEGARALVAVIGGTIAVERAQPAGGAKVAAAELLRPGVRLENGRPAAG
jgi:methionyl-tRNA formyltransferase